MERGHPVRLSTHSANNLRIDASVVNLSALRPLADRMSALRRVSGSTLSSRFENDHVMLFLYLSNLPLAKCQTKTQKLRFISREMTFSSALAHQDTRRQSRRIRPGPGQRPQWSCYFLPWEAALEST